MQPVLIDGDWRPSARPVDSFQSENPTLRQTLPETYPVSGWDDLERLLIASQAAADQLRDVTPHALAAFLEALAGEIEDRKQVLVDRAHQETGLPRNPRLEAVELPRTTGQLRQAAAAARESSWCLPTIDSKAGIRSKCGPLGGPVLVFGPNNFPFAFNAVSGGDFAAAVAAGNPVIAKANPGHPGTTQLLAEAALAAVHATGMPASLVQMVYHFSPQLGLQLVAHPSIGATAFTGSRKAGLSLKRAADQAGKLIYLEMSSLNPVILLPGALEERHESIADELLASCTLGAGQFCTNPGLVLLVAGRATDRFLDASAARFRESVPGVMLGARIPADLTEAVEHLRSSGAEEIAVSRDSTDGYSYRNTLLRVSGEAFLRSRQALQREAFGPVSLLVVARDRHELESVVAGLEGNLTGSIYSHSAGDDDTLYESVEPLLRTRVGRLLNDRMPTGVAVSPAMNHGGPYPATGHPGFTAVGIPASIRRFAALHCYDNVREDRLPPDLRDKNPGGVWRLIDGRWTMDDVPAS